MYVRVGRGVGGEEREEEWRKRGKGEKVGRRKGEDGGGEERGGGGGEGEGEGEERERGGG